ncbi:MAG: hypothetical protein M1827_007348 [Pycnora praestabilis]|nr:MAG: hypothetical protein M1827_007348 [Pycnora praestabilis]
MSNVTSSNAEHAVFSEWVQGRGVNINQAIAPTRIQGRGIGVVAQRRLQKGDELVHVPIAALLTVQNVPKRMQRSIGDITVHGLLAAYLTLEDASGASQYAAWRAVWPSEEDFQESNPIMWAAELQEMLPRHAKAEDLLKTQKEKLEKDFAIVNAASPSILKKDYLYNWLLVNTRTFYYVKPGTRKRPSPDDCMALCPIADYFNHADDGRDTLSLLIERTVHSTISQPVRQVAAFGTDGAPEPGEEIYLSYGNHSNDFLLVEYGFVLSQNKWDEVGLDHLIMPELTPRQRERLKHAGFLGNYALDGEQVCHRTQVAIRLLLLNPQKWHRYVNGIEDGEKEQITVDEHLVRFLARYTKEANAMINKLQKVEHFPSGPRAFLETRWAQIQVLFSREMNRVKH